MRIIFSVGDINGIGIEVMLKGIFQYLEQNSSSKIEFALACNKNILLDYSQKINFPISIENDFFTIKEHKIKIINCQSNATINFGLISKESGLVAIESLDIATNLVINNEYDALITLPITKKSMYLAEWTYPGHTEYLGYKTNSQEMMILASNSIRVALVTIHIPISKVTEALNKNLIFSKIRFLFNASVTLLIGI